MHQRTELPRDLGAASLAGRVEVASGELQGLLQRSAKLGDDPYRLVGDLRVHDGKRLLNSDVNHLPCGDGQTPASIGELQQGASPVVRVR